MDKITITSGKTFEVTNIDGGIVAHHIVDDGAVFVAMLRDNTFKAEIQYYSYDGVLLGHYPDDVHNFFGDDEVEDVKNELEKITKQ